MNETDLLAALGGAAVSFEVAPGVSVDLRPLSLPAAGEYRRHREQHADDTEAALCKLVSLSVILSDGKPLSEAGAARLPSHVVMRLVDRISKLNGWGEDAGN